MPDKIVEVPGIGNVSFPDSMSDDQINAAIKRQMAGPSLVPQGTAPKTDSYIAGPDSMSTGDKFGTLANMFQTGTAGAQLGAFLGLPGAIAGGALGAGAGLLLPPSETPGTDIGATAGDLAASFLMPGGLNTGRRLARIAADVGGTGLGALLGAGVDRLSGRVSETPIGRVILYPALSTPGAILKDLALRSTPAADAAARLQKQGFANGPAPLSFAEQTGIGGPLEKMSSQGTARAAALGQLQDAYGREVMAKVAGAPLENFTDVLMRGRELGGEGQKIMVDWEKTWKKLNTPPPVMKQVQTGVAADGTPLFGKVPIKQKPPETDWGQFMRDFGLTQDEFTYFKRAISADPDSFLNKLMPQEENPTYNLVKLRALMKVFDGKPEAGQLGTAYTFRLLGAPMQNGEAVNAPMLAKRIKSAIGSPSEPGALVAALGPDRADALRDLSAVLEKAVPLDKIAQEGTSMQKRGGSYLFHKIAFTAASVAGTGAISKFDTAHLLLAAGAGSIVAIGFPTAVSMVMMNPKMGQVWKEAAAGSAPAVSRILRTIGSTAATGIDKDTSLEDYGPTAAKSRLEGLFGLK